MTEGCGSRPLPARRLRLPNRRPIVTSLIEDAATGAWDLSVGLDEAGRACELFLSTANRAGSPLDALVHDACIILSRDCLQRGLTARELQRNLSERPQSLFARALRILAELDGRDAAQ